MDGWMDEWGDREAGSSTARDRKTDLRDLTYPLYLFLAEERCKDNMAGYMEEK